MSDYKLHKPNPCTGFHKNTLEINFTYSEHAFNMPFIFVILSPNDNVTPYLKLFNETEL